MRSFRRRQDALRPREERTGIESSPLLCSARLGRAINHWGDTASFGAPATPAGRDRIVDARSFLTSAITLAVAGMLVATLGAANAIATHYAAEHDGQRRVRRRSGRSAGAVASLAAARAAEGRVNTTARLLVTIGGVLAEPLPVNPAYLIRRVGIAVAAALAWLLPLVTMKDISIQAAP